MSDLLTQLRARPGTLHLGEHRLRVHDQHFFGPDRGEPRLGVCIQGHEEDEDGDAGPSDYLNDLLLAPAWREQTWSVVDAYGLLICLNVPSNHPSYRDVRGRSSRGRLSQGEYYHHDGCSGPVKPRVVEIRFPHQEVPRHIATAVAPFAASVYAMLRLAPAVLTLNPTLQGWHDALERDGQLEHDDLDTIQGLVTRSLRRDLAPEAARAFFRDVDREAGAYCGPWRAGESRLICNRHAASGARGTMQHRRAYQTEHTGGVATGKLVKRWPAEELL